MIKVLKLGQLRKLDFVSILQFQDLKQDAAAVSGQKLNKNCCSKMSSNTEKTMLSGDSSLYMSVGSMLEAALN